MLAAGCATTGAQGAAGASKAGGETADATKKAVAAKPISKGLDSHSTLDPFASTYQPLPSVETAIVGATILTGAGQEIENGTILLNNGKIIAVGSGIAIPASAKRVDGRGKFVTPGIIDIHSHLGVYPSP
ncbi:MAG: hypothetical protein RL186_1892, partial [Pseudomonadota bacterium]